jgi:hypothetical protein
LESCGSVIVGTKVIVNEGEFVRPSQLIASVRQTQWEQGNRIMASGESSQTWFPEMIAALRSGWRSDLSWAAIIELRDHMQAQLEQIRTSRAIKPPVSRCPRCGRIAPEAEPRVSVRAMLLALRRFRLESEEVVGRLEKAWARYRMAEALDLEGRPTTPGPAPAKHTHAHRSI